MKNIISVIVFTLSTLSLFAQEKFEVEGGIKIGNTSLLQDGIIRFTGSDFQGRVGGGWQSLLTGPQGIQGETGTQGAQGIQGETGPQGPSGESFWKSNGNKIYYNSGNVGLGLTNPSQKLHIIGTTRSGLSTSEYTDIGHGGSHGFIDTYGDGNLEFRHDGSTKMALSSNGRLGIGNTSPQYPLHVTGDTYVNGGWLRVSGSKGIYFQNYGGGFYMSDNTWIRIYGDRNIYQKSGILRTDGSLQVGANGSRFLVNTDGKVSIGNPSIPGNYRLYVDGGIMAEEVKVALSNTTDWADDAFERTPEIQIVETSINETSHLHDMPSVDELLKSGYDLQDMDAKLLQQIEWLWMHMIEMRKENNDLKAELERLKGD